MKGGKAIYRLFSITLFFLSMVIFCFLFSHPVSAATVNWVGGSLGNWNVPGNWSNSALPTSADNVTIDGANVTVPAGTTINFNQLTLTNFNSLHLIGNIGTGGSITISNSTLTQENNVQQIISGTLLIQSGAEIDAGSNTTTQAYVVNFKANTITLNSGGYFVSNFGDGPGYRGGIGTGNGAGPGGGQGSASAGAAGGSHGGAGGNGNTTAVGGTAYCTIGNISTMGSGGGGGGSGGGAGGGLIILEATGTMTLNGSILVNGGNGVGGTWDGGGAGGGVKLKAAIISGTPEAFSAAGGNGNTNGGGGGGGCVSLSYTTSNSINLSQISVTGGTGNHSGGTGLKSATQIVNQPPSFSLSNGVTTSTITTSSIPFSWNAGGGTETYYILQRSTDGINYTFVATTSVATTSYTFTGLTPGKGYWLEVASGDGVNATSSFAALGPYYTLANPAGTPTISSPTTSTLALTINTNGNDATTTYAIFNNTLSIYVAANGSSNGATPVYFTNANWTGTVTGLSINTSYQFSVIARNGSNINAATSALSTAVYTLTNPALAPTVGTPTTSTLPLTLNTNSNPTSTTYAIFNSTAGTYVAASGASNGATPVYFTSSSWTGTVTGLSINTSYQFSVIARNGDGVNAATSSLSTATYTLANPALAPTVSNPTASSLVLAINANSNPANTTYAIFNSTAGTYVAASGASNGSTPVYFTNASWTGTVTGLSPNTSYQFSVIARNGDGVNSATSSLSTATYTLANPAIVSTYTPLSTSTFSFSFSTNSNPSITTYAVYNVTNNTYIASNGSSNGGSPVYFTSSSWSGVITGLSINTSYQFSVIARNGDGVNSATSTASTAFYTLANPALAPTVSSPTASTLALTINTNSNPSNTTYSIFNNTTGVYVLSNGTAGTSAPSYFTSATWNGTVSGLSPNTSYQFSVTARNGDGTNAATSSLSTAIYTLANPALAPTVGTPTTSTLALTINTNSNPTNTTYAIYNSTAGTYVAASGVSNGATPVFFTNASWTGTVKNLTSNTSYQFSTIAQNGDAVNSATSSLSTATSTSAITANTPGTPTVSNPTTSTLQLTIATNGNDGTVTYNIYNVTNSTYVKADGSTNGSTPVYFTNASWNGTITGLSLNTSYQFTVTAKSSDNVVTATSTASTAIYTLANPALTPTISSPTTSSLALTINANSNPASTTYAIFNSTAGTYVAASGVSNGATPVYFTNASWAGTVTGLSPNTSYQFSVIARNGDGVNAATSSLSTALYTLANPAGTPTVSGPTTSTLNLTINTNSNPSNTTYAIYNSTAGTYVASNGSSNGSTPVFFASSSWSSTVIGLTSNTSYQFSVIARNSDGVNATTSSLSTATSTSPVTANTPGAPTISNPTTSTLQLTLDTNGNPSGTTYAIFNTITNTYVAANGSSNGSTPVFFTAASWNGTVTGLALNKAYQFSVIGKSTDNVVTPTSTGSSDLFTLANPALAPTVGSPTTSTLNLTINTNSNPSNTTYAIYNSTAGTYVASNGSSNGSTPVFFTAASWNGTVTGLTSNTSYQFSVIAQNGNQINAATSSLSTATSTAAITANTPGTPTVSNPTTSTLQLVIATNGNTSSTTYAIYNTTLGTYVAANGSSNGSTPVYFTNSSWTGTVTGLNINTSYQFSVIAKSSDNIVTATSTASTATYTLANPALAPTVGSPTTSTLALTLNTNTNPTSTTYAIFNSTNNAYVAADGSSNGLTPVFFTNVSWVGTVIGLTSNTSYQFSVIARNGDNVNAATSSLSTATSTSPITASVPGTPTVSNPTTSTLQLTIATNGNSSSTTYAIFNTTNSNYVAANGSSNGSTPVYFTNASWTGTVTGLSLNTGYQFSVIAKSSDNIVTATSTASTLTYTLANPPLAPTVGTPTTSTLALTINTNSNPTSTTYAIYNSTNATYIAANGTSNGSTPVFFTNSAWNGTASGLNSNTSYQFSVVARNGDGVNSATSSLSTATSTSAVTANTPGTPTVSNPTISTLQIAIATNGNDTTVTYAIYNLTSNNYLKADGSSNGSTPMYFTNASWNGSATGLSVNTSYQFSVLAKSSDNIITATSTASTAIYTLANPALAPTVGSPTTSTLALTINTNSNPSSTTYAIFNNTSGVYLASNGSSNGSTPVFFTNSAWNGTVSGLNSNTSYQFSVIAQNGDGINTATSSLSTATSTTAVTAYIPGILSVSNPTTSTIQITIDTNGNDPAVTFALYNITTGNYLTSSGVSTPSPIFFTNASWNNGSAIGLSLNTSYQFIAIAKSSDNVITASSTASAPLYTLANPPFAPTVGTPTTSTLNLTINTNSNPTSTTYAIFNSTTGNYLSSNGISNGTTPVYFTNSSWTGTVIGLTSNTSYQFSAIARNGDGINSVTSSLSTTTSTLALSANTPGTPTVSNSTTSTLQLVIATNGNTSSTTYAIYNTTNASYIAASGASNGATPVYFTNSNWSGTVTGLNINTSYQFTVTAKSSDNIVTASSSPSTAIYTLANPPLAPTVGSPTTSTLALTINTNSNPTSTVYALYNNTAGNYIASNGTSNGSTPVFFTNSAWNGTVQNLTSNTSYQFSVIAQNGDGVNTASSSLSTATSTSAVTAHTPGTPTVSNPTTSTLQLTINTNNNTSSTTYAIFNNTLSTYVAANGTSNGSTPVYFTNSSWTGTVTGLSLNTSYQFSVIAKSSDNIVTATSSPSTVIYTLANPPLAPIVGSPTTSTLALTLNTNSNPTSTIYAIYNSTNATYVDANGAGNGSTPVFFTNESWTGIVTGLTSNTSYQFSVIAQNGDGVNSATSSLSAATSTSAVSANIPGISSVSNPTTSTLDISIATNGNSSSTTYAIYNVTTGEYVASTGISNSNIPVYFTTASWNGTVKNLSLNTAYQFSITAQSNDHIVTASSTISNAVYTLAALPGAPILSAPTTSTLNLTIVTQGNPSSTLYSIYNNTSGNYITNTGEDNGATPSFFTNASWGGVVSGLTSNTSYRFSVIAQNGDGINTATSSLSIATSTAAQSVVTPNAPLISNPTASSLDITLDTTSNPVNTTYAIYNITTGNYIASNGTSNGSTPVYFTNSSWNGTVSGLSVNTGYQFSVIARNSDNITSATSSASGQVFTQAHSASTPIASHPSLSSLQVTWGANGNPSSTLYALYNVTDGIYIDSNGSNNGVDPSFFTLFDWNGVVNGLTSNTAYRFAVIAQNGDGINAATSSLSSSVSTLSLSADTPTVSNPTTSTVQLVLNTDSNPSSTLYALYNVTTNEYLEANGFSNGDIPASFTVSQWNGTVFDLDPDTSYQFEMISEGVVTSTASAAVFTLASVPGAPVLSNAATSTLQLDIITNGNPGTTIYALYNTTSKNFIKNDGTSNGNTPQFFTNSSWNGIVRNLLPNTSYQFVSIAKNGGNVITATSSPSNSLSTLSLTAGGASIVSNPTTSTLSLTLDTSNQPSGTTYGIFNLTSHMYLNADGTVHGTTPVFFTPSAWSGVVVNLSPDTQYQFQMITSNTTTSSPSSPIYTLALAPTQVTVSHTTASTITLSWSGNAHGFAVENSTAAHIYPWNSETMYTAQGLSCNTPYSFRVKARNGDGVETAFSLSVIASTASCNSVDVPPVVIIPTSTASTTAFDDTVIDTPTSVTSTLLLTPLYPDSLIYFTTLPEQTELHADEELATEGIYSYSGQRSLVYRLVQEITADNGSVKRHTEKTLVVSSEQDPNFKVSEKIDPKWKPGIYTLTVKLYNEKNILVDTNSFKFSIAAPLPVVTEITPVETEMSEESPFTALYPDSAIEFTTWPTSPEIHRGQKLNYTYRFTNQSSQRKYVAIKREVRTEQGKLWYASGGNRTLNPSQNFSFNAQTTLSKRLNPGTYIAWIKIFNNKGILLDQNGFKFQVIP